MRPTMRSSLLAAGVLIGTTLLLAPPAFADDTVGATAPPDGYYDTAEGKTGAELKAALHGIIDDHTTLSYDEVWDGVAATDADPNNPGNVILLYSGKSEPVGGDYNREHVWAKSHGDFGTRIGPGTDLHHLRPTIPVVNSTRSNLDFDNGGDKEVEEAPGNFYDSDSFEPRDAVKGDVARMILYMAVRYEGDEYVDLEPNDEVENGSAPYHGRLSVLKEWNTQDPPDAFERNRNDVIFEQFQHNRNPFIDRPEWVNAIWGGGDGGPTDPPSCEPATNDTDVAITDNDIVTSDVTVSGCEGDASASSEVTVDITHPDRSELSIYLFAPDGTYYVLKYAGGSGADIKQTYTVDLDTETANGTWTLSVKDYDTGDTGTINSW